MIIAIDAHCSCAPTLTGKMEQNLHINGYTRHFSPYFSVDLSVESFPTVEDYSTSRHDSPGRSCALKLYWVSYYTALQNVQKSSVYLNGPPQRSQVCNFFIFTPTKSVRSEEHT